ALFNYATGDRVPIISEMDMNRDASYQNRYALILRPAVPMKMGARHVMALTRDLTDSAGKTLKSPDAFRVLRDRIPTTNLLIEAVRPRYEAIFAMLEKHGYPRDRLLLAWDFSVASKDYLLGSVLSMRETVMTEALGTGLGYTITRVRENPDSHLSRLVEGTFQVPTYLNGKSSITYDQNHHPIRQYPNQSFPFTMIVPKVAKTRTGPLPLVIFGHGIFGTANEYLEGWASATIHPLANENGFVIVATDWIGMSANDQELIVKEVMTDLNRISLVTDRLQQSLINFLTLTELAVGPLGADPKVTVGWGPLVDLTRVYYHGASLGGIQGSSLAALSRRISRVVLAVPGSSWLNMITRSIVWNQLKLVAGVSYPDPLALQVVIAFLQTMFDHSDPINLSLMLFEEPLPDAPANRAVLIQESIGDSLVPNMTTELLVRARGIPLVTPSITQPYGISLVDAASARSALVQYKLPSWNNPQPPETNIPPDRDNGVHADVVFMSNVKKQLSRFLQTGEIEQFCDGACDPD
ncbi:MAG: hypothetical protein WC889_19180, partial [Myxococcota bacterium]